MKIESFGPLFNDRSTAGGFLAHKLARYHGRPDTVVLGLPRGGVPVAVEIARRLELPIDVLAVRKLRVPWQPELAFGAVGPCGVRVFDPDIVCALRLPAEALDQIVAQERGELRRTEIAFRGHRPTLDLHGQTAILADDGLATGATMRAAIHAARLFGAARIVVAVPVAANEALNELRGEADEVVCLAAPDPFTAVSMWYREFPQLSNREVRNLLSSFQSRAMQPAVCV